MKRKINFRERVCECCGKTYKPTCATQKWCSACGPIMRKKLKKEYSEKHKDEIKARQATYYSDPEKRDKKLKYNRKRYQDKKEEINAKNKVYRDKHRDEKRERNRKYREEHLEEVRERNRIRTANRTPEQREAIRQYKKKYYETNKREILKKQKEKRNANIEKCRERSRERYYKDIEKSREKVREYSKRPEVKEKINKRMRDRRRNDVIFILKGRIRKYILRCIHPKKDKHTFDILNYTPEQLRSHIESQFTDGMTWDNYGTYWSIDHIKPLSMFDFFNEDGSVNYDIVAEANDLMNLRPVLFSYNSIKGATWTEEDERNYQEKRKRLDKYKKS